MDFIFVNDKVYVIVLASNIRSYPLSHEREPLQLHLFSNFNSLSLSLGLGCP